MKKVDLFNLNLTRYMKDIDIEKIKIALTKLRPRTKYKNIIDNIENIIKADLSEIENKYKNYSKSMSKKDRKKIEEIFNYSGYRQNKEFMEHFKKLNIKSCPFCNNNYVYFYKKKSDDYNTLATLEHYYPKATYPHLSLSFYNLIPSCNTCNSKFKGTKEHVGNILHPYIENFDERATFSVAVNELAVGKDIELSVELKSNNKDDKRCNNSIERFQLKKIYEEHSDIAKEIWNKAQVYNEDRIEELYKSFYKDLGYTKADVKNFAFCSYLDKKDIHRRNHTKLTQDILKQFDLINGD